MKFLFDQHGAMVKSNTVARYGNSELLIVVGNLEFQFAQNERDGENRIWVGPRNGHGVWEILFVALAASTGEDVKVLTCPVSFSDDPATLTYIGLTKVAELLEPRFDRLNQAFAPQNYASTHSLMVQIERKAHPSG